MKLSDKKNGEVVEVKLIQTNCDCLAEHEIETIYGENISLETLSKYFEDYKPVEPLIKDEKVRKAVRAWAEATGTTRVNVWVGTIESRQNDARVYFDLNMLIDDGDDYTITELCGEEEE